MGRFRRTKEEIAQGLTPEQAMALRATGEETPEAELASLPEDLAWTKKPKRASKKSKGGVITIRITPVKGVDPDYFEHLRDRILEVSQDEHFYKWLDHYLGRVYTDKGPEKLFQDITDKGMSSLIGNVVFPGDIK